MIVPACATISKNPYPMIKTARILILPVLTATMAFAKPTSTLRVTVDGKPVTVSRVSLVKDGTLCLNLDSETQGGVGVCFTGDAQPGKPVEGTSITVHRPKADSTENLIGKGVFKVELTTLKLGTWKTPGRCSGKITLAIDDSKVGTGAVATAEGTFADVQCYAM